MTARIPEGEGDPRVGSACPGTLPLLADQGLTVILADVGASGVGDTPPASMAAGGGSNARLLITDRDTAAVDAVFLALPQDRGARRPWGAGSSAGEAAAFGDFAQSLGLDDGGENVPLPPKPTEKK
jgi:hypothetical protein